MVQSLWARQDLYILNRRALITASAIDLESPLIRQVTRKIAITICQNRPRQRKLSLVRVLGSVRWNVTVMLM